MSPRPEPEREPVDPALVLRAERDRLAAEGKPWPPARFARTNADVTRAVVARELDERDGAA